MAISIVKHEWNGHEIRQRLTDGYVNLTDMCKVTGYSVESFTKSPECIEVSLFLYQEQQDKLIKHPMDFEDQIVWADIDLCGFYARNAASYNPDNFSFLFWFNRTLLQFNESTTHLMKEVFSDALVTKKEGELERLYAIKSTDALYAAHLEKSQVYFILNKSRKQVKIGFSKNPKARLSAFSAACKEKLEIVCTIPGGIKVERKIHSYFAEYRIGKSELFRYEGRLRECLIQPSLFDGLDLDSIN